MLHNDGDKSASSHIVTVNGDPQLTDTAQFGQAAYFDGVGDYLRVVDTDDTQISIGTIDFWLYVSEWNTNAMPFSKYDSSWGGYMQYFSGSLGFWADGNNKTLSLGTPSLNAWHHIAIVAT